MVDEISSKRYEPPQIDLENENSAHRYLINLTGFNKHVLEIGTSTGYMSKILKERGNTITGIEIDREAGSIARQYCDRMIIGDIETLNLDEELEPASFDVVLCGDVLEHLKKPSILLKKIHTFLKPDGYLVVSLPNICHGDVLLNLLNGDFHCTSTGLLDKTHLHFYCLKNIFSLFSECNYQISDLHSVVLEIGETELKIDNERIPQELLNFLQYLPNSNTYQFIFIASPSEKVTLPEFEEYDLKKLFDRSLEKSILTIKDHFLHEVSIRDQHIEKIGDQCRTLKQDIAKKDDRINDLEENVQSLKDMIAAKEEDHRKVDAYAKSFEQVIIDKDQHIKNLDDFILSKDQQIKNLDNYILSLKETISLKENQYKELEEDARLAMIAKKNHIRRMNCHIRSLEKQLSYFIKQ